MLEKTVSAPAVWMPVIRPTTAADIPAITRIYAEQVLYGTATFEIDPPDEAEMERRRQALLAAQMPYIVAEDEGGVVGYAYSSAYRPRIGYRNTVEDSIYIAIGARGRGLGRRLLDRLIADTAALGYRQMIAVIGDSANTASIRLHEGAGFRLSGTFQDVGWKHGRWIDTVLMQRTLGSGAAAPPQA